jgi:hypothetical protein
MKTRFGRSAAEAQTEKTSRRSEGKNLMMASIINTGVAGKSLAHPRSLTAPSGPAKLGG